MSETTLKTRSDAELVVTVLQNAARAYGTAQLTAADCDRIARELIAQLDAPAVTA